ncbi:type IV secretion system DNA-binding domain-containing protein [Muricauda oceani]|uniref:Type IV secretory system conjugative DNA transfer family protein n=1 Tax=Flagellimonas oceani TaxID=2698672 RepID=A0A6G7IZM5_9FLAO|nr:type IV secretory system conjugative DNA transfer family protein [Allomuricauda oceani]MBW8244851.1 type IV secretion system DNA-binding domain-containing protein [Allomuricauda oceani]QII43839.1 type IV secretory system conjugative DNA transfer family protein [Allomuricauda oceani]
MNWEWPHIILYIIVPMLALAVVIFVYLVPETGNRIPKRYQVRFRLSNGRFKIDNLRRGISIIGSAGSGKTESVVYNLLQHFSQYGFCGVIHDYKDFELTEMAYPLFRGKTVKFHTIAFDEIHCRVNPIAPRYLPNEESVNEISRVLMDNLLERNLSENSGSSRFFADAVEGLLSGLIWKMKTAYREQCTLPHIIALYQLMDTKKLVAFLKSDRTSHAMASAFINGIGSEKQTAGVKSTLANAFKKISSKKLFYVLSRDEVPLDINNPDDPSVISLVNDPQYETVYSPIIATIIHTVIKQMSIRDRNHSFLLMEEAPTLKLPNMHRIPATLRSYDIATVYVMQDKVQNDMLYGDRASKAILSNLSYQFFGKVNDPDTAKYYERFFEIVKDPTRSVSKGTGLSWEARITKGEREVPKRRAETFFRLKQGEFIAFADGKDRRTQFRLQAIEKELPKKPGRYSKMELKMNFERVYREVELIFKK